MISVDWGLTATQPFLHERLYNVVKIYVDNITQILYRHADYVFSWNLELMFSLNWP